jgi:hypothetical protein
MTRRRRRSDRSGRTPLFSPGRPVVAARDEQRQFWAAIAAGMASEDAALQVGMSQAVGTRLFRKAGGMARERRPAPTRRRRRAARLPVSARCGRATASSGRVGQCRYLRSSARSHHVFDGDRDGRLQTMLNADPKALKFCPHPSGPGDHGDRAAPSRRCVATGGCPSLLGPGARRCRAGRWRG